MDEGISKKTIFIFLILTIFVSILSTWTLIENVNQVDGRNTIPVNNNMKTGGKVSLEVIDEPVPPTADARVSLTVT